MIRNRLATRGTLLSARQKPQQRHPLAEDLTVAMRVYQLNLGNCSLICFRGRPRPFNMLVDCGVLKAPYYRHIITKVVEDILSITTGVLDLLVVTRTREDHTSGFLEAINLFKKFAVRRLWISWTADAQDSRTTQLLTEQDLSVNKRIKGLAEGVRYCHPSDPPHVFEDLQSFRFYVLGPTHDKAMLHDSEDPYRLLNIGAASPFFAVANHTMAASIMEAEALSDYPFSPQRADIELASKTSGLTLAIEHIETGQVYLFTADPYVGTELSSQPLAWKTDSGTTISATDLLRRTVAYNGLSRASGTIIIGSRS